eukprot:Skav235287  [mRNA]  locus=scaffold874:573946:575515:- [translate_table: standard]
MARFERQSSDAQDENSRELCAEADEQVEEADKQAMGRRDRAASAVEQAMKKASALKRFSRKQAGLLNKDDEVSSGLLLHGIHRIPSTAPKHPKLRDALNHPEPAVQWFMSYVRATCAASASSISRQAQATAEDDEEQMPSEEEANDQAGAHGCLWVLGGNHVTLNLSLHVDSCRLMSTHVDSSLKMRCNVEVVREQKLLLQILHKSDVKV